MAHPVVKILSCCLLVTACSQPPSPVERANSLMRAHVASDVVIDIEPGSEKLFDTDPASTFVCGRATINQPGLTDNVVQRFIITANKALDRGIALFEGYRQSGPDRAFVAEWNKRCPAYTLPPLGATAGKPPSTSATNFNAAAGTVLRDQLSDPWAVLQALRTLPLKKGEFEKTGAYKARLEQIGGTTLYDNVQLNKTFAFEQTDTTTVKYDADTEQLSYTAVVTSHRHSLVRRPLNANTEDTIRGYKLDDSQRYYRTEHHIDLRFEEVAMLELAGASDMYLMTAQVKLSAQRAAAVKGKIVVVYVGEIVAPYYREDGYLPEPYHGSSATLYRIIPFKLKGIWLVDATTGEVLTRSFQMKKA